MANIEPWIERERTRLSTGHYKPIPPLDPRLDVPPADPRALHFPHISKEDAALIAYTQSPDKGARDIKTKIKPGAYLKKFFSDRLSAPDIARLANAYRTLTGGDGTTLHIATTPEECVEAYKANTGSCVSYANGGFSGHIHPASIYGDPDPQFVTVAYLKRAGRITAKALVNRAKRHYQSLHGDTATLTTMLLAQGYTVGSAHSLNGLFLHAILNTKGETRTHDGRPKYIAPCIDGHYYARHDAAHKALVLISHEEYDNLPAKEKISIGYNGGLTA